MLKPVIAATALLAVAGSGLVYAQQSPGGSDAGLYTNAQQTEFHQGFHSRPSAADVAAFTDARIAAMKAGLELTADQAKNWPAFEQAVRDMAQLRIDRIKAREAQAQQGQQSQPQMSPFDRLSRRADNMAKRSAALKKVAEAGAPLYQSLDDAQKQRFVMLARMLRPHRPGFERWRRFGEGYGRGFRGPQNGPGGFHHRMFDQDNDGRSPGEDGSQL
jgi:zinc resistance-associated protein